MNNPTPERLREIEARYGYWRGYAQNSNDQFALEAIESLGDLLAALKQVREERDQLAALSQIEQPQEEK
jgi:hypothetical protein